jgi:threonine/homoserine/homoserine lactone efflux protein
VTSSALIGFFIAVLPLAVTPGASFTLATERTLRREPHGAAWVIAGTATGIYCHALLAAVGLSALVMRSAELFTAVKVLGGLYLVGLGAYTLWDTRSRGGEAAPTGRLPWSGSHSYPQALLANVLNPKAASVYLTLAPQFLTARTVGVGPFLLLATVHAVTMGLWLTGWAAILVRGHRITASQWFRTMVGRASGAVLVVLGLRTLTAAR